MSAVQTAATRASAANDGHDRGDRNERDQDDGRGRSAVPPSAADPQPLGDVGRQVQRQSTAQAHGGDDVEGRVVMREGRLHAERKQDDPRHHRQVKVGEQVAGEHGALLALGLHQARQADVYRPVEVRPPQGAGHGDAQQRGRDGPGIQRQPGGADADGHDRLSEGDDDDQPMALDEVLRRDAPAAHAGHQEPQVVDRQRRGPDGHPDAVVGEARHHEQRRAGQGAGRDPENRLHQFAIAAAGNRVQHEVERRGR